MIIATAGHIDHGKTLLVRALTGIDADRLPEEKKRGMTIDLGFAYADMAEGVRLGFIDVPGHEKLVHNMLAGVTGIDCALLVVAADDGPMPQTREHLAILDLLGISRGMVALTKTDRVESARVEEVREEIALLLDGTTLADAEVYAVSAVTGEGVAALRERLTRDAAETAARAGDGLFRLAIDRVFTVAGAGLVVTGTAFDGSVSVEDRLFLCGADSPTPVPVRVRAVHANNREARTGRAGDRLALNLTGVDREGVARGDWLSASDTPRLYRKLDARVRVMDDAGRPLRHWTAVHVHLGAGDVTGRVAVLGADAIAPGTSALAQIVLDRPIGACARDRFILRDQSAQETLAGGHVVDTFPPARGRARPARIAMLTALDTADPAEALADALSIAPEGLALDRFAASRNLSAAGAADLVAAAGGIVAGSGPDRHAIAGDAWAALGEEALAALDAFHKANPDRLGPAPAQLRRALPRHVPDALFAALVDHLVAQGHVASDGMLLHRPGHRPGLTGADAKRWDALAELLDEAPASPPVVHELAKATNMPANIAGRTLRQAVRMGLAMQIAENRFFLTDALLAHARTFETLAKRDGTVAVAEYRQAAGVGRNLAVEILEYFDRIGLSRRDGNVRHPVKPVSEVFAGKG